MAAEVKTGMEKPDMKRLLMKSKEEPVNCAFGQGDDNTMALLMLDKVKQPKAVEKELTKEFPNAKNTRWGTAAVDTEVDPKLVRFIINKPVSSMARKLVKTLKGTGYTKVELLLEDGSPIEAYTEQEEGQPAAVAGEPPPPPGPAEAKPDPAALARALAELIKRIPAVLAVTPGLKDQLSKLATDANVNLKTNNLVYAATHIESLRRALDNAPQGPAPAPSAQPASPAAGAVAYGKSRLAWLAARKKVEGDIEKLRGEIVATYKADGIADKLDAAYRSRVAPVLSTLDESLADKLDEATNATDPAKRAALVQDARAILQRYQQFLASDDTINELDTNPFVPLQIRATIAGTLDTLSKAVR